MSFRLLLLSLARLLLPSVTLGVSLVSIRVSFGNVWAIAAFKVGLLKAGTWTNAHENFVCLRG